VANYAQMNPGKYHLGYRFPTPVIIDNLPMSSDDEHRIEIRYKHAVVVSRALYVGNVQLIRRSDGTIKVEGDSMYKSGINQFDVFVDYNKIEAAVADGESITALAEFANKILQFKQNTMYIINVSGSIEILEGTYKHKGVASPSAVCKTDYGVAWANEHGCYLYDGKNVVNLLEKEGLQKIKESDWQTFVDTPMVGYYPRKRQIIVVDDESTTGDGAIYLYDMVTRSWTKSSDAKFSDAVKSNLINDWNGDLVHATVNTPQQWSDTSTSTSSFTFVTKDIDFGQPSVRKKIYRVRISYKGVADNLVIKYSVNGNTSAPYDFEGTDITTGKPTGSTASSSKPLHAKTDLTTWHHAELKPDASSESNNVYSFQLHMTGEVNGDFEVNDISIVYRIKNIK